MTKPLVSIIIPTYNRAHLIGETLDSVLAQTYVHWECIIVDDGSTDSTIEVVKKYLEKDNRFQFHHRPTDCPKGGNAARNYGFEVSKGNYVKWFDSDDLMKDFFLEKQVNVLKENPKLDFCGSQWEYFFENGKIKKNYINLKPESHHLVSYFLEGHVFATPSPLWKKDFLKDKVLFDLKLFRSQEADFHFRMLSYNPNYLLQGDFLFQVRRGHDSIESNSFSQTAQLSVLRYFDKAYYGVKKLDFPKKELVLKYLIYRNLGQLYVILVNEKSLFKRLKFISSYKKLLDFYKITGFRKTLKVLFGFTTLLLFKKGYKFLK